MTVYLALVLSVIETIFSPNGAERVESERNIYREKRKGILLFNRTLSAAVEYIQTQAHNCKL